MQIVWKILAWCTFSLHQTYLIIDVCLTYHINHTFAFAVSFLSAGSIIIPS